MTIGHDTEFELGNACPVFAAAIPHLCRAYGRGAGADKRRTAALRPLVLALDHSRSNDAGAKRRGFAMADLARQWAARAFDVAEMPVQAAKLRDCEPIIDASTAAEAEAVAEAARAAAERVAVAAASATWTAVHAMWAAHAARSAARVARYAVVEAEWTAADAAARHAADAAMWTARAVAHAPKFAGADMDALDMCVTELLALVQRETGRAPHHTGLRAEQTAISDTIAVVACLPGPAFVAAALAATAELNAMRELLSAARAWEQSGGDVDKTHALRAALARCL